jgi:hypothetical protein
LEEYCTDSGIECEAFYFRLKANFNNLYTEHLIVIIVIIIIIIIIEQHAKKARNKGTAKTAILGTAHILRKVLM